MDFQEQIRSAGRTIELLGSLIIEAGDKENMEALPKLHNELQETANAIGLIIFLDRMMKAQKT